MFTLRSNSFPQVRLWCLTISAPKVTPIIVAALPIPSDLDAEALYPMTRKILDGLIDWKIQVVSYACDGTEVERAVQRLVIERADSRIEYIIKNPHQGGPDTKVTIPVIKGQAIAIVQDSKHALKTYRNNLFSGARLLVLGNFIAVYAHIRQLAFEEGSPLYLRDVEKLDRQDDSAATRLFSADVLKYLCDNHPDYLGEIVYLFVFGELIDAYQNRAISHAEHVKLVLRARYFLDAWEAFLKCCGYTKATYLLSRECLDITRIIIEGFLSLVFIRRDHVDGVIPLYPWLESSESCEHAFGEARQVVKDFTMLDFLYMIPKLRVKMRQAILKGKTSNPKARAAGYSHTYFDMAGLDQINLSTFPSDDEITVLARQAADEADSLIALLGLSPNQVRNLQRSPSVLPSINSWFSPPTPTTPTTDEKSETESLISDDDESVSEAQELQSLLDNEEDLTLPRTAKEETQILNLTCAALALATDEMMMV